MTFYEILTQAVNEIGDTGYSSLDRLDYWTARLRESAAGILKSPAEQERLMRAALTAIYRRLIELGGIIKMNPDISRFTLDQLAPKLRAELDRRIMASAQLIKLNRVEAIEATLRRFQGWSTSIPVGGSDQVSKNDVKKDIGKALKQLPFIERRVLIDQGHKLTSNINNLAAVANGALAVKWHSHWRQPNYNYRVDHKDRDQRVYVIKGSWALEKGLMKAGPNGYYDDITAFGEEVFCRCYGEYIYSLRGLPDDMITKKGQNKLAGLQNAG